MALLKSCLRSLWRISAILTLWYDWCTYVNGWRFLCCLFVCLFLLSIVTQIRSTCFPPGKSLPAWTIKCLSIWFHFLRAILTDNKEIKIKKGGGQLTFAFFNPWLQNRNSKEPFHLYWKQKTKKKWHPALPSCRLSVQVSWSPKSTLCRVWL